jgi:hypothetical protein
MFRIVGIIAVIAGIFWLGEAVGIEGIRDFFSGIWN